VVRGDLGESIRYRKPAAEVFFERLPNTLQLLPLAMVGRAARRDSAGRAGGGVSRHDGRPHLGAIAVLGIATPSFWLGIVLIYVFSIKLGLLPSSRMGGPSHYVLPAITLGLFLVAG
jgi:peptide/nickel transport system permease protein